MAYWQKIRKKVQAHPKYSKLCVYGELSLLLVILLSLASQIKILKIFFFQLSQYFIQETEHGLSAADDGQYDLDMGPPATQAAATLRLRAPLPHPAHITLNPYSTQLVDNLNRMMAGQQQQHIYHLAGHQQQPQQPQQLLQLTNTLKKKKCLGGHPGPCHHSHHTTASSNRSHISFTPDAVSVRSSSDSARSEPDTETDFVPANNNTAAAEVVFRAVSPHGHVYWEIDPKRPNKLSASDGQQLQGQQQQQLFLLQQHHNSDSDTNNDMHNLSDFSEDDIGGNRGGAGAVVLCGGDRSGRQSSSSRFSDHRPLISNHSSPSNNSHLAALPENVLASLIAQQQQQQQQLIQFSPHRFNSLQKAQAQVPSGFSTRTRLGGGRSGTAGRMLRGSMEAVHQQQQQQQQQDTTAAIPEQVQQQVTIPDLRRIPVSVKSSEYIMAKIQSHMEQRNSNSSRQQGRSSSSNNSQQPREREV